jgi:hypothetical protein
MPMTHPVMAALQLAMGRPASVATADGWKEVLRVALRERIAMLGWLRSALAIRRGAPAEVVAAWREHAVAADDLARVHLRALAGALAVLRGAGLFPVVLKGMPLAERLHGDFTARACTDIDLHLPASDRAMARRALAAAGWRPRDDGVIPWEESFDLPSERGWILLEVHSALVDHNLAHLPVPGPSVREVVLDGIPVPALAGPIEAASLAAHAAKHMPAPLLWFVDFGELWKSLGREGQRAARAAATDARLERYLQWAVERSLAVEAVAGGNEGALRALGVSGLSRLVVHAMWRDATLASHPLDAARAVGGWLVPRPLRSKPGALVRRWSGRLRAPWRPYVAVRESGAPAVPVSGETPPERSLPLDEPLVDVVRDVVGRGAPMWIRMRGRSMAPSIPSGALVRVRPLPRRALRRGEIVLADVGGGRCVVHRVVRAERDTVRLHGDAIPEPDAPVPLHAVLAIADRIEVAGRIRPLEPRPLENARQTLRRLRRAASRARRRLTTRRTVPEAG